MRNPSDYPFEVRPLSAAEGGGFLVTYPDFSDCLADGDTVDEALANAREALIATVATLEEHNLPVPTPNSGGVASGKFVACVPKSIHAQLALRAKTEGVSLNTLVVAFLAEGLGQHDAASGKTPYLAVQHAARRAQ